MMKGLNEIIKDLNVVEICTVKQSYHEPALLKDLNVPLIMRL